MQNAREQLLWMGELGKQEMARRNLIDFIQYTFPEYQAGWFHKEVCERLQLFFDKVQAGERPRLMLFSPPRHGKTEIVSRRFPAWALGKDPELQIISSSHSEDLANTNSMDVQGIINCPEYEKVFPDISLDAPRRVDMFHIKGARAIPSYLAAGVRSRIGGFGARILLIDDPVPGRKEANSPTEQETIWDWINSVAFRRVSPDGGILFITTRWHPADPAGRLIESIDKGAEPWDIISYPAMAEEDDEHRKAGEALDEVRWPLEVLKKVKAELEGALRGHEWLSLYQQRPQSTEGRAVFPAEMLKWHKTNIIVPKRGGIVRITDDPSFNFSTFDSGMLRLWEAPIKYFSYCAAWDVAEGEENILGSQDSHCVGILRRTILDEIMQKYKVNPRVEIGKPFQPAIVATWHGLADNPDLARIIIDLLTWYGMAPGLGERNSYGAPLLQSMKREYPQDLLIRERTVAYQTDNVSRKLGIYTTGHNKAGLVEALKEWYLQKEIFDPDEEGLEEMSHFIHHGGKLQAESRYHDDHVAMRWLLCYAHKNFPVIAPRNLRDHEFIAARRAPIRPIPTDPITGY